MFEDFDVQRIKVPIPDSLSSELIEFWEEIFQCSFGWLRGVLSGEEVGCNDDALYIVKEEDRIASTVRLTISRLDKWIGLVGDVATSPESRGRGLAKKLCKQALHDFHADGGEATYLCTGNPVAAKLYTDLGWRQIRFGGVMVNVDSPGEPEDYLASYFESGTGQAVKVVPGDACHRIPIVPLIVAPHDFEVLDSNTSIRSTKFSVQSSCEGLYQRYVDVIQNGAWFVAERADGAVVGISSVKSIENGAYCVEAFTHPCCEEEYLGLLYETAIRWANERGASNVYTTCQATDSYRRDALNSLSTSISLPIRDLV